MRALIQPDPAEGEDLVDGAALPKTVPSFAVLPAQMNSAIEVADPLLPLCCEDAQLVRVV